MLRPSCCSSLLRWPAPWISAKTNNSPWDSAVPLLILRGRHRTSACARYSSNSASSAASMHESGPKNSEYYGPLTPTFRRLKIFSLSSLTLSFALTPFIFVVESSLPFGARLALAATAMGTSGLSTTLVAWAGRPYVTALRHIDPKENDGIEGLEMTTLTLGLHRRITRVYDTEFLMQTERPFAKWELAQNVNLSVPKPGTEALKVLPSEGEEETVAETTDAAGNLLGRWVVKWGENGVGTCQEVGKIVRHFNVHEELLH